MAVPETSVYQTRRPEIKRIHIARRSWRTEENYRQAVNTLVSGVISHAATETAHPPSLELFITGYVRLGALGARSTRCVSFVYARDYWLTLLQVHDILIRGLNVPYKPYTDCGISCHQLRGAA